MKPKSSHSRPKKGSPSPKTLTGTITVTPKGVGYIPVEGMVQDIEIAPHFLNTALHGDTVEFALLPEKHGFRRQGEVLKVLERAKTRFAGVLKRDNGAWIVNADHRRMYRDLEVPSSKDLKEGFKVVVRMLPWSNPEERPKAVIEEILGPAGSNEAEIRAIVIERGFETGFPADVEREATEIRNRKQEFLTEELKKRKDFRDRVTFTIDPADAKDFDDAISIKKLDGGLIELGVHIADVSAYVIKGDAIDREAVKRGTSIYLVDRTVPMLPEVLSNDLCSINPGEDKLAFSAVFTFDMDGNEHSRWFGRTVINSKKRFTYENAQAVLDGKEESPLRQELKIAETISAKLRAMRFAHGAIAFETDEVKFKLDDAGKPLGVYIKDRTETMLLIEDLMLHANKAVAEFVTTESQRMLNGKTVFVYRIHDSPKPERIMELALFLKAIGKELKGGEKGIVSAKSINALFRSVEGTPEQSLIETAAVRSMAKAVYSLKNIGHFGLSFKHYTHFTSPIRRYPDLMVHRMLQAVLDGHPTDTREYGYYEKLCTQCSEREVSAAEAERDSVKYKQVEFMMGKIGQVFAGVISGVTDSGIFVQENESKAEGLVRLRTLDDDWYQLDQKNYAVVGEKTHRKFRLGDKVKIRLTGANLEQKMLDWEIVS